MNLNKFTILIPTRERSETLYHTIRTCLNQTYKNLEVIVCDNFSQDATKEVVNSFDDIRLKYINTGKRVSMSENFDFALSHTKDGYVMFIGDDDAILPNSLEYVNEIINKTACEAVVSHNALYIWPQESKESSLHWCTKKGYEIRDSKEWINKYLSFRMQYTFDLPGAYCGFVKRSIFDNLMLDGEFFKSATPDAYSAIAVAFSTDKYVYSHTPFAVHGSSAKSNGGAYLSKAKNEEGEEVKQFFKENTISFHSNIIMTKAFRVCSLEAFLQFSDAFPHLTKEIEVDWKMFLKYVLTERSENTKGEIEEAVKEMCDMHSVDYNKLLSKPATKFTGISAKEIFVSIFGKVSRLFNHRKTFLDNLERDGIYNVYDSMIVLSVYLNRNL